MPRLLIALTVASMAIVSPAAQAPKPGARGRHREVRYSAHGGRQTGFQRELDQRDDHAARTHAQPAAHPHRRGGARVRNQHAARAGSARGAWGYQRRGATCERRIEPECQSGSGAQFERRWQAGFGAVGGYNSFWVDTGERVLRIDGQPRSSILVDPSDGRLPPLTPQARARSTAIAEQRQKAGGEFDHPELRPLAERCIMSFGNNAGPPMLPNYWYNNNYTFVQTRTDVMLLTEMVHDARVVRIGQPHGPETIRQWMGDSIARWEGDALIVETTNFHPQHGFRGAWEH